MEMNCAVLARPNASTGCKLELLRRASASAKGVGVSNSYKSPCRKHRHPACRIDLRDSVVQGWPRPDNVKLQRHKLVVNGDAGGTYLWDERKAVNV
jgi:hypothetical protein